MSFNKILIGKRGEKEAASYLQKIGLKILKRNWRCPLGEIDLIAKSAKSEIVFVEIKTRSTSVQDGWESIDYKKRKKLHRLALSYLKASGLPLETPVRFDAVIVLREKGQIYHEPNAFMAESEI